MVANGHSSMLILENLHLLHEENHVGGRHLGFQVVTLYMVPSSIPLVLYANIAGSFIAFDNHVRRVTSKISLFKFKIIVESDRDNLLIKLSNRKSVQPVEDDLEFARALDDKYAQQKMSIQSLSVSGHVGLATAEMAMASVKWG